MNTDAAIVGDRRPNVDAALRARRYFHATAAVIMLLLMLAGFWRFYLAGENSDGQAIAASIHRLVVTHGALMTAWVLAFTSQALLISARRTRWHRALGGYVATIGLGVAITGFWMPIESVRLAPDFNFWGMPYRQFLLVMFAETAVFTTLATAGVLWRKRREAHRAMMLMATLSIMAGATVRMPVLSPVYGEVGWWGLFGPIFTLGAAFVVVHSLLLRSFDRWLAGAYAFMVVAYVVATTVATSARWDRMAAAILGV